MHHQACRKIAPGLVACGHASGGLVEAIEKPDYPFFLGVQWHPEYLWEQGPAIKQIFEAFINAARSFLLNIYNRPLFVVYLHKKGRDKA